MASILPLGLNGTVQTTSVCPLKVASSLPVAKLHSLIVVSALPEAVDIDGDGLPEIVLGSDWKPFNTSKTPQLSWLERGKSLDDEWTMYPIPCDEPTIHRVRVIEDVRDGKPRIISVPLMGREATAKENWMDSRPVRVLS
jgi:hypothetical protein